MKNIFLTLTLSILLSLSFSNDALASNEEIQECPMGSAETLVCEVVLCSIGLFIEESQAKCIEVTTAFTWYLATLGFWDSPPSCKQRDENCNKTGTAKKASTTPEECAKISNVQKKNTCLAKTGHVTEEYCNDLKDSSEKSTCLDSVNATQEELDTLSSGG